MKAMRIVAAQPTKQTLEMNDERITYNESSGFGMGELSRFPFDQIDTIARSTAEPPLAIEIERTIIELAIESGGETHNAVIAQIVAGAQKSVARSMSADSSA
ncbi:MAG: hypothetical protein QOK37_1307 [Thermoanaerobaculia bacterium]|jgi:hypothetical protein|nr:hypothetical protein [Thermoanaerobaculia bacterium]